MVKNIHPSDCIKYLGIYLDYDLSGRHQCFALGKKLNRSIGMLSKARHYIPSDEIKSLYYTIFSSHMTYGCQIWHKSNIYASYLLPILMLHTSQFSNKKLKFLSKILLLFKIFYLFMTIFTTNYIFASITISL